MDPGHRFGRCAPGVAKSIVDKYRFLNEEYEIELSKDGAVEQIKYYRNDKRKRKLK